MSEVMLWFFLDLYCTYYFMYTNYPCVINKIPIIYIYVSECLGMLGK